MATARRKATRALPSKSPPPLDRTAQSIERDVAMSPSRRVKSGRRRRSAVRVAFAPSPRINRVNLKVRVKAAGPRTGAPMRARLDRNERVRLGDRLLDVRLRVARCAQRELQRIGANWRQIMRIPTSNRV